MRVVRIPEGWVVERLQDARRHANVYPSRAAARKAARALQLGLIQWQKPRLSWWEL